MSVFFLLDKEGSVRITWENAKKYCLFSDRYIFLGKAISIWTEFQKYFRKRDSAESWLEKEKDHCG